MDTLVQILVLGFSLVMVALAVYASTVGLPREADLAADDDPNERLPGAVVVGASAPSSGDARVAA